MNSYSVEYWEKFYLEQSVSENDAIKAESSFARYIEKTVSSRKIIVDLGTGNGRDAKYFAQNGNSVLAVDSSTASLEWLKSKNTFGLQTLRLDFCLEKDLDLLATEVSKYRVELRLPVVIYARFLFHAIPQVESERLLKAIFAMLHKGDVLAIENRAQILDQHHFGEHFRRSVPNSQIKEILNNSDFKIICDHTGRGLSVMGDEDPLLGRFVIERN